MAVDLYGTPYTPYAGNTTAKLFDPWTQADFSPEQWSFIQDLQKPQGNSWDEGYRDVPGEFLNYWGQGNRAAAGIPGYHDSPGYGGGGLLNRFMNKVADIYKPIAPYAPALLAGGGALAAGAGAGAGGVAAGGAMDMAGSAGVGSALGGAGTASAAELAAGGLAGAGVGTGITATGGGSLGAGIGGAAAGEFSAGGLTAGQVLGGGSALGRLLGLGQTGQDVLSVAGGLIPAGLGYLGADKQSDAYRDMMNRYLALGEPSRARLEASYAPDFDLLSQPGYGGALNRIADISARSANVKFGNPYDAAAQGEIMGNVWNQGYLPALANYRGQQMQGGGLGLNTSGAAGLGQVGAEGGKYNSIGYGVGTVLNPQPSLADLMREYSLSIGGRRV